MKEFEWIRKDLQWLEGFVSVGGSPVPIRRIDTIRVNLKATEADLVAKGGSLGERTEDDDFEPPSEASR